MIACDWCGSAMVPVGAIETGMARGLGRTWLCTRKGCGHELEVIERVCQFGLPVRSFHGFRYQETWPELDRSYWHPCIKGHVGQCRGQATIRMPTYPHRCTP